MTNSQGHSAAANFRSEQGFKAVMAWYDQALDRVQAPTHTRHIPTRFGQTHLVVAGPDGGPPLIMLPGWGANAAIFFGQIDELAAQGYRVVAVDTIGQAGRSAPVHLDVESDDYALWLGDLLDELAIERAHLLGITGGGWLALRFAAHSPDRILSLALISPMGLTGYKRPALKTILLLTAFALLPMKFLVGPYMRLHVSRESALSDFGGEMLRLFFRHYKVLSLPWPPVLSRDLLGRISAPALVLFARDDVYFEPASAAQAARSKLANAEVEILSDMGHLMIFDQPERVNQRMLDFLDRV